MKNADSEFKILERISRKLEYPPNESEWKGSDFAWIKKHSSSTIGAINKKLVAGWLTAHGFNVLKCQGRGADILVEGKRVTIKSSMLWAKGIYKFQQLRDQDYDLVICLGISPSGAHCWVIPKTDVMRLNKEIKITGQHASGTDTAWFGFQVDSPPQWLAPFGGSLSEGIAVLSKITGFEIKQIGDEPRE